MSNALRITLITIGSIVVLALLSRYVIFREQFDAWGEGLRRIEDWQTQYKKDHPDATKEEMDAAFDQGIANIRVWMEQYKRDHPGATDAEAEAAFEAMWK